MLESLSAFWAEYGTLLLEGTRDTLIMTGVSTLFAYVIGLPLGVLLSITSPMASGPTNGSTGCWAGSSTWAVPCPSSSSW